MTRKLTSVKRRKRTNSNMPAKGRLREMADALWSLAVRNDWNHKCAVCGSPRVEAHHIIPRQWYATRYELRNGIALCASHHQFDADISPHQNAAGWCQWLGYHHTDLHDWYTFTVMDGKHKQFEGTKNAQYYCDVIRSLREYVEEDDYVRIIGVRFNEYLDLLAGTSHE